MHMDEGLCAELVGGSAVAVNVLCAMCSFALEWQPGSHGGFGALGCVCECECACSVVCLCA